MSETQELYADVGGNYTPPPSGMHAARCITVAQIGTIEETFEGHKSKKKKIVLSFELSNTNHVFDEKRGPEPFVIHQEFTFSMHPKAKLRKTLTLWRGQAFTDQEAKVFSITKLIGATALINLIHDKNSKGDTKVVVAGIMLVPPGTVVPALRTKQTIFLLPLPGQPLNTAALNSLPKWVQSKIKTSDEYKALGLADSTPAPASQDNGGFTSNDPFSNNNTITAADNSLPADDKPPF